MESLRVKHEAMLKDKQTNLSDDDEKQIIYDPLSKKQHQPVRTLL